MIRNEEHVLAVHKPVGMTSNQVALRYSARLRTVVGHTGNLDPMAEGVLVLLIGPEANQNQDRFKNADKEYRFEVLFGVATDSYDPLGLVTDSKTYETDRFPEDRLKRIISGLVGRRQQRFPPFSYKKVRGKSLLWWARHGRMDEIQAPARDIMINHAVLLGIRTIGKAALRKKTLNNIRKVRGDFRQREIERSWETALKHHPNQRFAVATIQIACSKGTYVRSIARQLGRAVGLPSLALRVQRTRNGPFNLADCRKLIFTNGRRA